MPVVRTFDITGPGVNATEDVAGLYLAQPIPRSQSQPSISGSGAYHCYRALGHHQGLALASKESCSEEGVILDEIGLLPKYLCFQAEAREECQWRRAK